ncbi:MAG TPA: hypothetical protein DCY89_04910 [Gammaproteobacteria bacterium]|nr:hypothetical protein [Gammaproteobacteria bacterium]
MPHLYSRFPSTRLPAAGLILLASSPAHATFETLPTGTVGQPVTTVQGNAIQTFDTLHIPHGATIPGAPAINQFALPANFNVVSTRNTTVMLPGQFIGQAAGVPFNVGTLIDQVLFDTNVNRLVFSTRLTLAPTVAGVQNVYEVNDILRRGFTGQTVEAAWTRATNSDLRMYSATRTSTLFGQGTRLYDPDVVLMQTDVNVSEGNPWSAHFLLRTTAQYFDTRSDGLSLFQGGEEGQPLNLQTFAAFAPSAAILLDNDNDGLSNSEEATLGSNPSSPDSDGDGLQDGLELGRVAGVPDPDGAFGARKGTGAGFVPDLDPASTTNVLNPDTDGDGITDGTEDANRNGRMDAGETDPNVSNLPATVNVPLPFGATLGLGLLGALIARRRLRQPAG